MVLYVKLERLLRTVLSLIVLVAGAFSFCSAYAAAGKGVEVKPFGVLDVGATFGVHYTYDGSERNSTDTSSEKSVSSIWEEQLWLRTKSYVYHPGFLNIQFDAGPKLVQQEFKSNGQSNADKETLLGYRIKLNFLQLKSYPFSVYANRSHPSISLGLVQSYKSKSDEHGFNSRIAGPGRSSLHISASNRSAKGTGFNSVVDEDADRAKAKLDVNYGAAGNLAFEHSRLTRKSLSGSPGLPIQPTTLHQDYSSIASRHRFGVDNNNFVNQNLSFMTQELESANSTFTERLRYSANARIDHLNDIVSLYGASISDFKQSNSFSKNHKLYAGFSQSLTKEFRYSTRLSNAISKSTGFDQNRLGLNGTFNFSKSRNLWTYGVSASVRQDRTKQESSRSTVRVFDEELTLTDTTPVDIRNEFVVAETIIISNVPRTQVFVEGLDYRLIIIGNITSVQRLIDGNILDGQTVSVDYEYRTTGTATYDTFNSNIQLLANFSQYFYTSIRYFISDIDVRDGELTNPINSGSGLAFEIGGTRAIGGGWTVDGYYRLDRSAETIAPSTRNSLRFGASTTVWGGLRLRASAGILRVDQETSVEDVDQVNLELGLRGRLFRLGQIGYNASYLRDTGGSQFREHLSHRFIFSWRYRLLRLRVRAHFSDDSLGQIDRLDNSFFVDLERVF